TPQTQREPTNSQVVLTRQRPIPSLPEAFTSSKTGVSPSETVIPQLLHYDELAAARSGPQSLSVPMQLHGDPGANCAKASYLEVQTRPEALTAQQAFAERQDQRPTGALSDKSGPCIPVTEPAVANVNPTSPAVRNTRRQPSWQSATWSDVMSESQKPATLSSHHPGQGQESPWNLGPPLSVYKRVGPVNSDASHDHRHVSTPSASTNELVNRLSSITASYPEQPLSPQPPPPSSPANNVPALRLRPQPVFTVLDSGKSFRFTITWIANQEQKSIVYSIPQRATDTVRNRRNWLSWWIWGRENLSAANIRGSN
ncbi:MAG: hypothetical protein Q9214_007998, partial [Letrouitia sp. 1 TL-2023]